MKNLSQHGYERMKERLGFKSVSKAERQVKLALERGKRFDLTGEKTNRLIRYIKKIEEKTNDIFVSLYDGAIYLFSKDKNVLITVYHLKRDLDVLYKKTNHEYKSSKYFCVDLAS